MNAETNTSTYAMNNIALINSKTKKKPHNVIIKNNRNEPKIQANMKFSEKQNYRRYKTKTEPKLNQKIMIDEEDDLVAKIRKEFGITTKKEEKPIETSGAEYIPPPEPIEAEPTQHPRYIYQISEISTGDLQDLSGQIASPLFPVALRTRSRLQQPPVIEEDIGILEDAGPLIGTPAPKTPPKTPPKTITPTSLALGTPTSIASGTPASRSPTSLASPNSRLTELSTATSVEAQMDDLYEAAIKRGVRLPPGKRPTTPIGINTRVGLLMTRIREHDRLRGAYSKDK
jgi:hypothetical protein